MRKSREYYELHAEVCKTFGHPKRLMIISILMDGEFTVGEIAEQSGIDSSNLSQHLNMLRNKGLVSTRRDGTKIYYNLAHPNISKAVNLMSEFLEQRIIASHKIVSESKI